MTSAQVPSAQVPSAQVPSAQVASAQVTSAQVRLRPNVLAHPSPTVGRFLLLVGTLLSAGLLAGTLIHNVVMAEPWVAAARVCAEVADAAVPIRSDPAALLAHNEIMVACLAPNERTRALYSVGGAVLVGLLGLAVVALTPTVLRRRYRLRPAGPRLVGAAQRIEELASQAGLRRPPRLLLGTSAQRDAFVFGLPGRYDMVLPTALAVRWRQQPIFDSVVRHELAHLRRHDVPLAWLATAVWIAAIPVLAAPVVLSVAARDVTLMPAYLWRALIVMVILWLVQRQVLRSREHDADLHAARQAGDWRPLCAVLELSNNKAPGWWRRALSHHPTLARRLQVLADPGRIRGVSVVDGMAAGFLTAVTLPMIQSLVQVAATGSPVSGWSTHIAAALMGPVVGLAVGVGLWRQAMIDRVSGATTWPGGAVLGVVTGLLIGQAVALDDLGLDDSGASQLPAAVLLGAAAVLLSAGTGQLWADAAARLPGGPRSWWIGFVVNALVFAVALWAMQWIPVVRDAAAVGGFGFLDLAISFGGLVGAVSYLAAVPLVISAAALVWRRQHLPTPAWLVDGPVTAPWPPAREPTLWWTVLAGAIPGLLGAVLVLLHRFMVGSPTTDGERINRYVFWLATAVLAALAVSLVTVAAVPRSGPAVGLVTGAVTAFVAALGIVAANTFVIGNIFDLSFWWSTILTATALWFAGYLVLLPVTLVVWPAPWKDVPGRLLTVMSVLIGGLTATAVFAVALLF